MDLQLKGKTALISGSSKGIGLSIAQCLFNEGCNVVLNSRNSNTLQKITKKMGDRSSYFSADVTKVSQCKKLADHTIKVFGGLDILICNVGDGKSSKPGNEICPTIIIPTPLSTACLNGNNSILSNSNLFPLIIGNVE